MPINDILHKNCIIIMFTNGDLIIIRSDYEKLIGVVFDKILNLKLMLKVCGVK